MPTDPSKIDWNKVTVLTADTIEQPQNNASFATATSHARQSADGDTGSRLMGDLMRDFGISHQQAAGVVGPLSFESGGFKTLQEVKPLVPGSRGGFGYAQWTGPRRRKFEAYVAANGLDPNSYEANYGFLKHEILNDPNESKQFEKVRRAKTAAESAQIFTDNFLRPGIPHMSKRLALAEHYAGGLMSASDGDTDSPKSELSSVEWESVPVVQADGSILRPQSDLTSRYQPDDRAAEEESETQSRFKALEAESPGRYLIIPQDQYDTWKAEWDAKNQSTGIIGDTTRLLKSGWAGLGLAAREAVRAIPGVGDSIVVGLDSVDEWMHGQKSEALLGGQIDKAIATLTPSTRDAREKLWWDSENGRPGTAWADPRSYYAGVVESVPGTVLTMGPSMVLARGAYVSAIARGTGERAAAAAAARTALIAGAVTEGILGGGQAAHSIREQIAQMPQQALAESEAVQQLMRDGNLTIDDAVAAITDDAATQAFVIAGAATGAFGGFGDRVLAKILTEGVGGNIAQRIVKGATREGIAEGVFEEAPQEAGSTLAENIALKNTFDPDRELTEGVANAAAGGLAIGGAMGGGIGAAGGVVSRQDAQAADGSADPSQEAITPDRTPRKGSLSEAIDHAKRSMAETAGASFIVKDPAIAGMPASELNGIEVKVAPDQDGVPDGMKRVVLPDGQTHILGARLLVPAQTPAALNDAPSTVSPATQSAQPKGAPAIGTDVRIKIDGSEPIMARVAGYEDGEAIVMDVGTGELLQVPLDKIDVSPAAEASKREAAEREDNEPIPSEITIGELPPEADTGSLAEVPLRTPEPGQRVIVEADGIERFSGQIQSYEKDGDEVLVRKTDGTELQVPRDAIRVSVLTDDEAEDRELKDKPPVSRETITHTDPKAREVLGKQVVLPDDRHARLFDLGKLRRDSKQTLGAGALDLDDVSSGEQSRLADEFGVTARGLGQIADDYRYRVENAAKKSKTRTPINVWRVNKTLIERMRAEESSAEQSSPLSSTPSSIEPSFDWDSLPTETRKAILKAANVKRAPSTRWADFPANIRQKLEATQQVSTDDRAVPSLDNAAQEAATSPQNDLPEPTQAQKEAGNYQKGHVALGGFNIAIENPKGSQRKGVDPDGNAWSITMKSHYGYFKGTVGRDKDHIDTFIRPGTETLSDNDPVFVIDQVDPSTGKFDEHKIMLGYQKKTQAERAYRANYEKGWKGLGNNTQISVGDLKKWFSDGDTKQPFARSEKPKAKPSLPDTGPYPDTNRSDLSVDEVKAVLRSKEWKKVFGSTTNINADTNHYAHPESGVAYDQAAGWLDAKNGKPPHKPKPFTPVRETGFNPINPYLEAYWGAKTGEARKVRSSEAVDVYNQLTNPQNPPPTTPTETARKPKRKGKSKSQFSGNKLFTEDKVIAARKRLRAKLKNRVNTGIDPEVLVDGMTIAGAYIESGVRKFSDYAKAMIKDLGPNVRPYLLSFYEGARNYPGLKTEGMDSVEDAKAAFDTLMSKRGVTAKGLTPVDNSKILNESSGGKLEAETGNADTDRNPADVRTGDEGQSSSDVSTDADSGATGDLFGQPDRAVERKRKPRSKSGNRSVAGRDKPAVPGQSPARTAGSEQRVSGSRGNRDGTDNGTDRKPQRASRDYRISDGELTRQGSWRATAERNVQIVELIKQLETEGREATADERSLMVQFTGWGASEIANGVFPNTQGQYKDEKWKALGERLKAALSEADYKTAARSTQYAHYTSESVIRSIYDGLRRIGFAGGNVLEPGMGTGHFRGLMPSGMSGTSRYTGIEFDGITSAIAKHLYPDSRIVHGDYTEIKLPKGYFDAAIGNPPFAQSKITNDPDYRKHAFSLHDYFFAKTIDRVKPGGVMVFVTSRFTMDKKRDAGRRYLADRANLLGAVRLPQTAFQANAGTEVVTDVLFLQKRGPGIADNGVSWTETKDIKVDGNTFTVNQYIADHPEMVLGSHAATGSMYRKNDYTVTPDKSTDIEEAFADAVQHLPESVFRPSRGSQAEQAKVLEKDFDPKAEKEGGLYLSDGGELMIRQDGVGQAFVERQTTTGKLKPLSARETQFLKDFISLRDAVKQTQYDQLTDGDWEASLKTAKAAYQAMVDRNGRVLAYSTIERTDNEGNTHSYKRFKNEPLFMIDPDGPLAFTLEKITESGEIVEGSIFSGRVLNKPSDPEIVTTQDAMFVSLDKMGTFDLTDVAKRAGRSEAETINDLGTAIYETPGDGWLLADEYLSGNVVQKLAEARAAAELDPKYARNVDALLTVQPRPLDASEIDIKLGAPWLPASDIETFAKDVLGQKVTVRHNLKVGTWQVEGDKSTIGEFAMDNFPTADILNRLLNNSQLRVSRPVITSDGKRSTETDPEATEKLNDISRKIRERFRTWIWTDADRSKRLVNFYNDNYNNIAPRQFDGSHLTLPGTSLRFNMHPHQKRAIWRGIQTGDTYLAHAVGSGKTFEMIALGMEERRLGLSKKPLYVVPNHMLAQFQREFLELYPAANIMVADEKNFHTSNRRKFIAQAALNDPDAIIITHSAFGKIGLSPETYDQQVQDLIDDWKELQEEIEAAEGKGLSFKRTQSQIERLEKRLKGNQKREAKDAVMTFEELGVDRLLVDELHEFRKLDFVTNQGSIKGIDPQGSQKAMDLFAKVTYLRQKNKDPNRVLVGASGTPVTNTMGELYTVQRLFQPDVLEDIGAHNFDAWSAQFGDIVEGLEQNAAGKFETVSRFARFQNVPELMRRVRSFMDILTSSSLGELVQRPTRINPPREVKTTPTPDGYKAYQDQLDARITAIRKRKGPPKKGEDIILKVIADGRFSAIDMRFVHPEQDSDPDSKLNQMLDDIIADYKATSPNEYVGQNGEKDPLTGSTLVVFSDIGLGDAVVKSRGFDMKAWIEKRLTDAGIQKDHFAFIRDHKSHAKKERLFADLREGKKRILIGGKDMETGVNVQKRLTHLYHLDAPWFPASVEQREGRADRQGNQNENITLRAYATKGSYDSTMWSMNARKARFIEQALNGDDNVRKMEDVSEASAFEMAAALSSGDPRYLQLAGLRQEVERLGRLRKAHSNEQNRYKRGEHSEEGVIAKLKKSLADFEAAAKRGHKIESGKFSATADKKSFDKRDDWAKALYKTFLINAEKRKDGTFKLGGIGGHDVNFYGVIFDDGSHKASLAVDLPGDMADLADYPTVDDVTVSGIGQRAVNQVNSVFSKSDEISLKIEQAERRLKQIRAQIGAPFPEESLYLEKQAELSDLELELQSEAGDSGPTEADKAGSAKDVLDAKASAVGSDEDRILFSQKSKNNPVARLTGDELGVTFSGSEDMPALRNAAMNWYRENLIGTTATTKDGLTVEFKNRGLKKSTYGRKGDVLLRSVPAIRDIIEQGTVVLREPGNRQYVQERIVITAPVETAGVVRSLAVTLHRTSDGNWHYDLHSDREVGSPGVQVPDGPAAKLSRQSALEGAPGDLNLFEWRPKSKNADAIKAELDNSAISDLVARLIKKGDLQIVDELRTTSLPDDTQGYTDADGNITLVANNIASGDATAVLLHEAFHTGRNALFTRPVWDKLEKRLSNLYRQFENSQGAAGDFFAIARSSVEQTGARGKLAIEEFGAYAIEAYETAPRTIKRWAQDVIGVVKAWMLTRFGRQLGSVTPAQLRALSVSALRDRAFNNAPAIRSYPDQSALKLSRRFDTNAVREQLGGRWTDLTPSLLSLVPLNYFEELKRPGMGAVGRYLRVKRAMDGYRSEKHETMDAIAQKWRRFASRNRKSATQLATLMHDATLAGIDPAVDYGGLETPKGYATLKSRFDALPPAARALYKTVRNSYVKIQSDMDRLILDNVQKAQEINEKEAKKRYDAAKAKVERDPGLDDLERREKLESLAAKYKGDLQKSRYAAKARMTRLRQTFEKNRVPAPYFPLARFGNYFVSVRDMAGDVVSFTRFESDAVRRRWLRQNKSKIEAEYPGVQFEQGVLGNAGDIRQAMDPRLVAEIDGILKDANVDQEVMDAIYQKWLQSLPDLSVRKRYIHRKGTQGFHKDALRAFASHMFHAGHQMGKLKYGLDLQEAVDEARDQARRTDDPTRAGQLVNELTRRHDWVMNPKGSKLAQKINSAAFVWYLAATAAAAIINMTQPLLFGIPVLGARLGGITKASTSLLAASSDLIRGKGNIGHGNLNADEKRAIRAMHASGAIDRTMAMEIAGIGDSGVEYAPLRHAVMEKIAWMFHRAEVVNREVVALAAYRMAREQGQNHERAIDTAHELNFTVNYDYANSSRPRILQSDFAKIVGVFMSYQLNVWYRIFRDIHQSFSGDTPQARKEARYQLVGLMGMQTLMGGTSGFFMYNVLMSLAGLFFDDEDDPFSFKHEAERAIYDLFGTNVGGMIINGVPGHLANIDLTNRIGMADFFLRMPEGSKEGKDWWLEFIAGSLGASVGAVGNAVVGAHYIKEGDTARGLELMVPKAVKDVMKTWRYANEGLLTRKGDEILPREDIDTWNLVAQITGFTPAKIATAHELRGRKYEAQNRIKDERSTLINRFAIAVKNGDVEARKRAVKQIVAWNKRSYARTLPITRETLERSLKTRRRLSARREDGFLPINEMIGAYLSDRTPENPYR